MKTSATKPNPILARTLITFASMLKLNIVVPVTKIIIKMPIQKAIFNIENIALSTPFMNIFCKKSKKYSVSTIFH